MDRKWQLTFLRAQDLASCDETPPDAMTLQIIIRKLAVIKSFRIYRRQRCNRCTQILDCVEVLQKGVEITRIPELVEAPWHLGTRVQDASVSSCEDPRNRTRLERPENSSDDVCLSMTAYI